MNFSKKDQLEIIENTKSWILVVAMFIYGFGKLFQFDGATEIDKAVAELNGIDVGFL
jgi:D-alanyl-lipoteichoic acid acyltransferase DltB (MBOAT superfamily)|tara:strand:- start:227 stop:397 length:171 start_codon:yes stop_codon:yes gene_type:complete